MSQSQNPEPNLNPDPGLVVFGSGFKKNPGSAILKNTSPKFVYELLYVFPVLHLTLVLPCLGLKLLCHGVVKLGIVSLHVQTIGRYYQKT